MYVDLEAEIAGLEGPTTLSMRRAGQLKILKKQLADVNAINPLVLRVLSDVSAESTVHSSQIKGMTRISRSSWQNLSRTSSGWERGNTGERFLEQQWRNLRGSWASLEHSAPAGTLGARSPRSSKLFRCHTMSGGCHVPSAASRLFRYRFIGEQGRRFRPSIVHGDGHQ